MGTTAIFILVGVLSAVAALGIYILISNTVSKNTLKKRKQALRTEAETDAEMIKKEKIL